MRSATVAILALLFYVARSCDGSSSAPAEWDGTEETISSCDSQGKLVPGQPLPVFNLTDARGGYLSYVFLVFAIEHFPTGGRTIMTITIDGDAEAALSFHMYDALGIWPEDERQWGNRLWGKGGKNGAVYSFVKAPFAHSVLVTATMADDVTTEEAVWTCGRAVVGDRVSHAGKLLPASARLRLYVNSQKVLKPMELVTLGESPANTSSVVLALSMLIDAPGLNSFEGCFRQNQFIGDGKAQNVTTLIGGGLEDMASSSFYFQQVGGPRYIQPTAGVTHFEWNPHGRVALYRLWDEDVMVLPASKAFRWSWRNGETEDVATGLKCVNLTGPQIGADVQDATVTSHLWVYEF